MAEPGNAERRGGNQHDCRDRDEEDARVGKRLSEKLTFIPITPAMSAPGSSRIEAT